MNHTTELQRIEVNHLDAMPSNPWRFDVDPGSDPEAALDRLKQVLSLVARHSVDRWPSDQEWEALLPDWVLRAIPRLSKEQTDRLLAQTPRDQWDSLPWERLSWLDALRDRGWRWWGWDLRDGKAILVVHIAMYPERIDAFKELLRAAGMRIVGESYSGLGDSSRA